MKKICVIGFGKLGRSVLKVLSKDDYRVKVFDPQINIEIEAKKQKNEEHNNQNKESTRTNGNNTKVQFENKKFTSVDAVDCDCIIVTVPGKVFSIELLNQLKEAKKPTIIASTSIPESIKDEFRLMAANAPLVVADNYSIIMNKTFEFIEFLSLAYDFTAAEVTDIHHKKKIDSSGTARKIAQLLSSSVKGRSQKDGIHLNRIEAHVRIDGVCESLCIDIVGDRREDVNNICNEINRIYKKYLCSPISEIELSKYMLGTRLPNEYTGEVTRVGIRYEDVPGVHLITLENKDVKIVIEHIVVNRSVFAVGIACCVENIVSKNSNFYTPNDLF